MNSRQLPWIASARSAAERSAATSYLSARGTWLWRLLAAGAGRTSIKRMTKAAEKNNAFLFRTKTNTSKHDKANTARAARDIQNTRVTLANRRATAATQRAALVNSFKTRTARHMLASRPKNALA